MLESPGRAVAVISFHASPLGDLGRGENGGMNLVVRRLCEGLSAEGIPTDVFVRRDDEESPSEELIAPRSRLVRLPAGPARRLPKGEAGRHVDLFAEGVVAHALSERRTYRLVHGHYWLGGMVAQRLREVWGRPWVQSFHTLGLAKVAAGLDGEPRRAETERALAEGADALLAASGAEATDLERLYGVIPGGVTVVRPGVDAPIEPTAAALDALRRRWGLQGRRAVLFAARLEPLKGAETALRVMAELAGESAGADVSLLVVGDNSGDGGGLDRASGGERGRLEALAADLGITDHVRFAGAVGHEELAIHHALAEVCLVPSLTETFGLVALEAQAMGTPVVASRVGGLGEVVEDRVTGFLVEARDPRAFAEPLRRLLADDQLRGRMAAAGRDAARRFTWSASVERLGHVYDGVAPRSGLALPVLAR